MSSPYNPDPLPSSRPAAARAEDDYQGANPTRRAGDPEPLETRTGAPAEAKAPVWRESLADTERSGAVAVAREQRPTRRLQMITVVVGFLMLLTLLFELAQMVLYPEALTSISTAGSPAPRGSAQEAMVAFALIAVLVLAPLTMLLAAASAGRYRFLAKLGAVLLFLGAAVRLCWGFLDNAAQRSGVWLDGRLLGRPVFELAGGPVPYELVANAGWIVLLTALGLTLIGLIVLAVVKPKAVASTVRG